MSGPNGTGGTTPPIIYPNLQTQFTPPSFSLPPLNETLTLTPGTSTYNGPVGPQPNINPNFFASPAALYGTATNAMGLVRGLINNPLGVVQSLAPGVAVSVAGALMAPGTVGVSGLISAAFNGLGLGGLSTALNLGGGAASAAGGTAAAGGALGGMGSTIMSAGAFLFTNPIGWAILGGIGVAIGLFSIFGGKRGKRKKAEKAAKKFNDAYNNLLNGKYSAANRPDLTQEQREALAARDAIGSLSTKEQEAIRDYSKNGGKMSGKGLAVFDVIAKVQKGNSVMSTYSIMNGGKQLDQQTFTAADVNAATEKFKSLFASYRATFAELNKNLSSDKLDKMAANSALGQLSGLEKNAINAIGSSTDPAIKSQFQSTVDVYNSVKSVLGSSAFTPYFFRSQIYGINPTSNVLSLLNGIKTDWSIEDIIKWQAEQSKDLLTPAETKLADKMANLALQLHDANKSGNSTLAGQIQTQIKSLQDTIKKLEGLEDKLEEVENKLDDALKATTKIDVDLIKKLQAEKADLQSQIQKLVP